MTSLIWSVICYVPVFGVFLRPYFSLALAIPLGLIFGYLLRAKPFDLQFRNPQVFQAALDEALKSRKYQLLGEETERTLHYRRNFLTPDVIVSLEDGRAQILGPYNLMGWLESELKDALNGEA
jgi:hypothetical protein